MDGVQNLRAFQSRAGGGVTRGVERRFYLLAAAICIVTAMIELSLGRVVISKSGLILLWVGDIKSAETSQQILDWYSFSHFIHGILLYALIRTLSPLVSRRRWSVGASFAAAIFIEASWEVLENSSFIINRYRTETIALGYTGDSILNSMSDIACCAMGFAIARRLPWRITVALVLLMELGVGYAIRDNLLLNIIMLICPFDAIKQWQMGAG